MVYDVSRLSAAARQAAMSADVTSSSTGSSSGSASSSNTSSSSNSGSIDMTTFLQLIVAQIKNQDPSSPTDGTQFVTELAQMQQLEQSVQTGQDVSTISTDVGTLVNDMGGSTTSAS